MELQENKPFEEDHLASVQRQSENEKTPTSKIVKSHTRVDYKYFLNSRKQHETKCFEKAQFSTPKNKSQKKSLICDNELSITNPFENQSTLDSLLLPSFSPSVFQNFSSVDVGEGESLKSPASFWNIDQIALMKPADIDLSKLHEQQNFVKLDSASEYQAQKAIDDFFANVVNMTSPWSSNDHPCYLAIISPSPAQIKQRTKQRDNLISPSVLPLKSSQPRKQYVTNISPAKNKVSHSSTTTFTQTDISIPTNLDLVQILAPYKCTFKATSAQDDNTSEILSTSTLRRKLFSQSAEDLNSYDKSDCVYAISNRPKSPNDCGCFNCKSSKSCTFEHNKPKQSEQTQPDKDNSNCSSLPTTVDYFSSSCNSLMQSPSVLNSESHINSFYNENDHELDKNSHARYSLGGFRDRYNNKDNNQNGWEKNLSEDISFLSPIKPIQKKDQAKV